MSKNADTITIDLSGMVAEAAALAAVARTLGLSRRELVTQIISIWAMRTPGSDGEPPRIAVERMSIVHRWLKLRAKRGATVRSATHTLRNALLAEGIALSIGTLYNWERRWRQHGIDGLRELRCKGVDQSDAEPFLNEVRRLYLLGRKPSLRECYRKTMTTAERSGWNTRSYKTVKRRMIVGGG